MRLLKLSNGMMAQVDDCDFDGLLKWKWTAHYSKSGRRWYAERNGKKKTISMHRQLMNFPEGILVDHKDRNGLNNQRSNLRQATRSQNNANRRASRNNISSQFLGVAFEKDRKKWTARIRKNGIGYRLGSFATEHEAAEAYNLGAIRLHGEFANLNKHFA